MLALRTRSGDGTCNVLVTGGHGFLGRAVTRASKAAGARVVGIGRGHWPAEQAAAHGFDVWLDSTVSVPALMTLGERFDLVLHCAGNGSVGYSLANPLQDFQKTVLSTAELLEFLRLSGSRATVVYPSSAGVYGAKPDAPIHEDERPNPVSPYGWHKKMVEDLLQSYSRTYGIRCAVIRFFSIYGPGLTKQLLWDATNRLRGSAGSPAIFWGTGEETRDWIHCDDAARLMLAAASVDDDFVIVNGANGDRVTIRQVLDRLQVAMGMAAPIAFNGAVRDGDPRFYHADVGRAHGLGWTPRIGLDAGLNAYARWHESLVDG